MLDLGTVRPGTTLYIPFNTFDSNDPSASVTLTGLATTDIEIYKDGSTTQRASDNGYSLLDTDGIDFDAITGIHGISINLADNSTAGFYAAGSQYWVVIASVTVDAATINFIAATFRIGYPDAIINTTIATLASQTSFTLTSGPAEDDALNGMSVIIHDVASAVQLGHAVISDYTGSTKTVTLAAGTTFTAAATDNISIMRPMPLQPTTMGRTIDVSSGGEAGVDWANVGSPTTTVGLTNTTIANTQDVNVRSISGDTTSADNLESYTDGTTPMPVNVTQISGDTTSADNLESYTDGTTPIPANVTQFGGSNGTFASGRPETNTSHIAGSAVSTTTAQIGVNAVQVSGDATAADNLEAAYDGTGYAHTGNTYPWTAAWDAEVQSEVQDAIEVNNLDHLMKIAVDTDFPTTVHLNSVIGHIADNGTSATFDRTTDSLEAVRDKETDIETDTQDLQSRVPAALVSGRMDSSVGAMAANTLTASALATDAVTEIQSGLAVPGSAMTLTTGERTSIAEALLKLDLSTVTGEAARSVLNAIRFLRNKFTVSGTTLTVYKEDDATSAWTGTVTTNASADPITGNDPT